MSRCEFNVAWIGQCKNQAEEGNSYCKEHQLECTSCGSPADHSCHETCGLVCGAPLCDACEHELAPDGTSRYLKHCKKGEQKFKPWFMQSEEEKLIGEYLVLKNKLEWYEDHEVGRPIEVREQLELMREQNPSINFPEVANGKD